MIIKEEQKRWVRDGGMELLYAVEGISSDSVIFDIGVYGGRWTKEIAERYGPNIYGFEPVKEFYRITEKALASYPKVKIFNFGLGGYTRQSLMSVNGSSSSLVEMGKKQEVVRIVSIKEFMSQRGIDFVDLASINIEGGEYELLDFMFSEGLMPTFGAILLQLHEHTKAGDIGHRAEREAVREKLNQTHEMVFSYDTIWDCWTIRK